jgi:hypothetical protein
MESTQSEFRTHTQHRLPHMVSGLTVAQFFADNSVYYTPGCDGIKAARAVARHMMANPEAGLVKVMIINPQTLNTPEAYSTTDHGVTWFCLAPMRNFGKQYTF